MDWVDYTLAMGVAVETLDLDAYEEALAFLRNAKLSGRTIYVAGNGGSASIANHLGCDFGKGSGLKVVSLVSNISVLTAYANDTGYENSIAGQMSLVKPGDIVILISSSGSSPNILKAAKAAKEREAVVIGLSGFGGGKLAEMADISLHIASTIYGVVEDAHSMIMHSLSLRLNEPLCGAI